MHMQLGMAHDGVWAKTGDGKWHDARNALSADAEYASLQGEVVEEQ
jgi:hypothetical protein